MKKEEKSFVELNIKNVVHYFNKGKTILDKYKNTRKKDEKVKMKLLGDAAENFFKYIILLNQYLDYNGKFTGYLYDIDMLDELFENDIIDDKTYSELNKYREGKLEDFVLSKYGYYFKYIDLLLYEKLSNGIFKTLKNITSLTLAKDYYLGKKKINTYDKFSLITNNYNKENLRVILSDEDKRKYKSIANELRNKRRDIQDRYINIINALSNPKTNIYDYNSYDIFELVDVLYRYCSYVHENNDNYDFDVTELSYWKNVIEMRKIIDRSEKEIKEIMAIPLFKDNIILSTYLFESKIDIKDIRKYAQNEDINENLLKYIFTNNVPYDTYIKLVNKGFSNELIIKTINTNGNDYEKYDINYHYFELLPYMNYNTIKKIDKSELKFLIDKKKYMDKLFNGLEYDECFSAYIKLLKMSILDDYKGLIRNIDFEQLAIYSNIDSYLNSNLKLTSKIICQNVLDNIKTFDGDIEILKKVPIMLNANNNNDIMDLLVDNGLDEDNISNLDGTIFCYPKKYVTKVFEILDNQNISVIDDNKLNPNVIRYISQLIQRETNHGFPPKIIVRP